MIAHVERVKVVKFFAQANVRLVAEDEAPDVVALVMVLYIIHP
jgi:hypothetical protein